MELVLSLASLVSFLALIAAWVVVPRAGQATTAQLDQVGLAAEATAAQPAIGLGLN
jgi:hypothetical protein